jgi:c-di-AMP phosphodiesterase-like protein
MNKPRIIGFYLKLVVVIIASIILFISGYLKLLILLLILYVLDSLIMEIKYWRKNINDLSFTNYIEEVIGNKLYNIFIPIVLIKEDGEIIWYNAKFNELKKDTEVKGQNITTIIKGINLKLLSSSEEGSNQKVKIDGNIFDIESKKVYKKEEGYIITYFNNISDRFTLEGIRENVMLIEVDNITEVLEGTEEYNRPIVIAEIERTINTYAHDINAMIKRYDNNKYVLSVQDKYIDKEIEEKFSIVDTISKINKGNKIEVTLSIGIGRGGISPLENSKFATVAIDLALGRGGDQVVIKNHDEIKFFGGNSNGIEKRTRVRARVVSHALKELIVESNRVLIIGHNNPDMDCFGSSVALSSIIKQLGRDCNIILNNDTIAIQNFLFRLNQEKGYQGRFISLEEAYAVIDDETLVIVLDVHNKGYVTGLELIERAKKKVIIDHHRRSPDMIGGSLLSYIEVYASSTSEMITEIIQYITKSPKLNELEAEGLMAGIVMDTKGFSFKTGVRTFEAASFLRGIGADTIEVKKLFIDNIDDYIKIAETIKSAEVNVETRVAIAICPSEVDTVIVAKSADELLNLAGISVSFVLAKIDNDIYISGRSMGEANVQVVLEALGGGGHMNMAGAKMLGISMSDAILCLRESIDKYLKVGE